MTVELCDMVSAALSAALRATETTGSCIIQRDESDVNEDAGGVDDSE
jgi:hypothetical protein